MGEGDGDGWLRARNYRGEEGYVPHNYLDVEREQSGTSPGLTNQISFSSVDYTIENEDEAVPEPAAKVKEESPEKIQQPSPVQPQEKTEEQPVSYCCALYDYDGEGEEELTFEECQVIKVISKCAHSVDDGWWRGELEGRIGNFPSLVVEECNEFGDPLSNQWDVTPPCSAPPVFTPPDIPEFAVSEVSVTDATSPEDEHDEVAEAPASKQAVANKRAGFEMEMSPVQHEQYGAQFGENTGIPSKLLFDISHLCLLLTCVLCLLLH